MRIVSFIYNDVFEMAANGYLLIDRKNDCVMIDPGKEDKEVVQYIKQNKLNLKAILLTHGHFDHIGGVNYLLNSFSVPVYIHEGDKDFLRKPRLNCSDRFSRKDIIVDVEPEALKDGQVLKMLDKDIKIIHTPFHTKGSSCFYIEEENILFSGDTLFFGSIGRTDFPTAQPELVDSSLAKLMRLKDETKVYPGHMNETSIGLERKQNPFVKR